MAESFYYLQYHLYTVAMDQWLRSRLENYNYDRHFGGVFYFFIRGIDESGEGNGIFYDLPDNRIINALRRTVMRDETDRQMNPEN